MKRGPERASAVASEQNEGARPKLERVVNPKGARALGVTIPKSVLPSADEVLE